MGLDKTQLEQVNMGPDYKEEQLFCFCQQWVTGAWPQLFIYLLSTAPSARLGQS